MNFEEFFNSYCSNFTSNNNNNSSTSNNNTNNGFGCNDMPGGFQDLDPNLFVTLSSLVGIISAKNLPFNLQNAIGNWFELLGQAILTFNAQQQYFQNGPGRYYEPNGRNTGNATCPSNSSQSNSCNCQNEINELKKEIEKLAEKLEKLEGAAKSKEVKGKKKSKVTKNESKVNGEEEKS